MRLEKKEAFLIIFTIVSVSALFLLIYFYFGPENYYWGGFDFIEYDILGKNLAEGNGFSLREAPPYLPSATRLPGYPLLLALSKILIGSNVLVLALQIIFLGLIALLTYRISFYLFSSVTLSMLAALFMVFDPDHLLNTLMLMSDLIAAGFLLLSLYFLLKFAERNPPSEGEAGFKYFYLAVASLVLSSFIRPTPLLLIFLYGSMFLWVSFRIKVPMRKIIYGGCLVFLIVALPFGFWLGRNYKAFGILSLTSSGGIAQFLSISPAVRALGEGISQGEARKRSFAEFRREMNLEPFPDFPNVFYRQDLDSLTWFMITENFSYGDWALKHARAIFRKYPGEYLRVSAVSGLDFLTEANWSNLLEQYGLLRFYDRPSQPLREILAMANWGELGSALKERFFCSFRCVTAFILTTIGRVYWIAMTIGAVFGFYYFFRDRKLINKRLPALIILFCILYTVAVHVYLIGPSTQPRYRLPIAPFLVMFGLYGVWFMKKRIFTKRALDEFQIV